MPTITAPDATNLVIQVPDTSAEAVQEQLEAEIADRVADDEAETSARSAEDTDLRADLEDEIAAREDGDADNATAIAAVAADLLTEVTNRTNAVTAEANARNTAVTNEATARANADNLRILSAEKGAANGVAPLDGNSFVPEANLPATLARDAEVTIAIQAAIDLVTAAYQAYADQKVDDLVDGAPNLVNTLNELAAAIGDDPNFAATITAQIAAKQAQHANLTALSGLVLAANKLPYANGAGTLGTTDFTAWARTWIAIANAADARTALGLGTAAQSAVEAFDAAGAADDAYDAAVAASQPHNATLDVLAGLPTTAYGRGLLNVANMAALLASFSVATQADKGLLSAADKTIIDNLGNNFQAKSAVLTALAALATTAFGNNLLTLADAAALRTAAGLGTAATHNHTEYEAAGAAASEATSRQLADAAYDNINTYAVDTVLSAADLRCLVRMNKATAVALQIPTDATWNAPVGTHIDFGQAGAGQVTVSAVTPGTTTVVSAGATPASPKLRMQYSGGTIVKVAANSWVVYGDVV